MDAPLRDRVTIVSGLPRSGTSMMMKMLQAGGLDLLVDGVRVSDQDNPEGYFEFEPVKKTAQDPSWVGLACGKAVKVTFNFLPLLPPDRSYAVVFMTRKMEEVLASQRAMLDRRGEQGGALSDRQMGQALARHVRQALQWARRQKNFRLLEVDYGRVLADPLGQARRVSRFLGCPLDAKAMAAAVNPALYRQRK
jgi:hypothetical protein